MTMSHAVLAGLALIAGAIALHSSGWTQTAPDHGAYTVTSGVVGNRTLVAFRLNTATGAISYCDGETAASPPRCSPWTR